MFLASNMFTSQLLDQMAGAEKVERCHRAGDEQDYRICSHSIGAVEQVGTGKFQICQNRQRFG